MCYCTAYLHLFLAIDGLRARLVAAIKPDQWGINYQQKI